MKNNCSLIVFIFKAVWVMAPIVFYYFCIKLKEK
jgi:hypothetical protein